MKKNEGFTLAEMLIVVAIIGVLVAVLIPTFTSQLEKAKEATDAANIRSAMTELANAYLEDGGCHLKRVTITQSDLTKWTMSKNDNKEVLTIGGLDFNIKSTLVKSDSNRTDKVPYFNILIDSNGQYYVALNGLTVPKGTYVELGTNDKGFTGRL